MQKEAEQHHLPVPCIPLRHRKWHHGGLLPPEPVMLGNSSGDMLMQGLLYFGGNIKPTSSASLVMRDPPGFSLKDCNALQPHPTLIKLNGNNLNHICGNWMFAGLAQVPSEVIRFFQRLPLENFCVCVPIPNDLKVALY